MRSALRISVAALLFSALISNAHDAMAVSTGAEIYDNCHAPLDNDPTKTLMYFNCIGFIEGAASMARINSLALKLNDFCVPPGTSTQGVLDAVVGYIATVPAERRKAPAAMLVYAALVSGFPCK